MRHDGRMQRELSWFLIAYLMLILGVLLGVHLLQGTWSAPSGASKAPARQERAAVMKQAVAGDADMRRSMR